MSLSSALRELHLLLRSEKLWLVFLAVVALFTVTGPFGTMEALRFFPRLGYWLAIHALTWLAALICVIGADALLHRHAGNRLWRMLAGSAVAALPIAVILELIDLAALGRQPSWAHIGSNVIMALPLSLIFCLLSYLVLAPQMMEPTPTKDTPTPVPEKLRNDPPILQRLKHENRGALLHISVEDHYSRVTTSRGYELILLRFADAIRETGNTDGLQVHRSHWVADTHVRRLDRDGGRLELVLADDSRIPVSRTYAPAVRERFG